MVKQLQTSYLSFIFIITSILVLIYLGFQMTFFVNLFFSTHASLPYENLSFLDNVKEDQFTNLVSYLGQWPFYLWLQFAIDLISLGWLLSLVYKITLKKKKTIKQFVFYQVFLIQSIVVAGITEFYFLKADQKEIHPPLERNKYYFFFVIVITLMAYLLFISKSKKAKEVFNR